MGILNRNVLGQIWRKKNSGNTIKIFFFFIFVIEKTAFNILQDS